MALMSGEYKPGLIPGFFIAPSKPVKTIQNPSKPFNPLLLLDLAVICVTHVRNKLDHT